MKTTLNLKEKINETVQYGGNLYAVTNHCIYRYNGYDCVWEQTRFEANDSLVREKDGYNYQDKSETKCNR